MSLPPEASSEASAATRLRRMRWWDVEQLVLLERELFPDEPWTAELFWSELAGVPSSRHYLVAERDTPSSVVAATALLGEARSVLGYAGLATASGDADVQTLAVRRDAQGGGVGAVLLAALIEEAGRRRCAAVMLEVRADNDPARRLYERFGFERISVRRGYYASGRVDALVMRRRRT